MLVVATHFSCNVCRCKAVWRRLVATVMSETCATIVCSCKAVGAALHLMHGESVRGASAGGEAADRAGRSLKRVLLSGYLVNIV